MNVRRLLLLIICVLSVATGYGADKDGWNVNVEQYPDISFRYNVYSRDTLNASDFTVRENGVDISPIKAQVIPTDDAANDADISLAIVWDIPSLEPANLNEGQQYMAGLMTAIENVPHVNGIDLLLHTPDDYCLSVEEKTIPELRDYINGFSGEKVDSSAIKASLIDIIDAGIDKTVRCNTLPMIIVYTDGNGLSSTVLDSKITKSREAKVPINIVYSHNTINNAPKALANLTNGTFGKLMEAGNPEAWDFSEIVEEIKGLPSLHKGYTYEITYRSPAARDGQRRQVEIKSPFSTETLFYESPRYTLGYRIKDHPWWTVIISVMTIAILGISGWLFGRAYSKKRKAKKQAKADEERQRAELSHRQQELNRRLLQQQHDQQRNLSLEQQRKATEMRNEKRRELTEIMIKRRVTPRISLQDYDRMCGMEPYVIQDAVTTIGSADDNDVVISNPVISRHHAEIHFDGRNFEVIDNFSTNGTYVHGQKISRFTLRNADVIVLGNVPLRFYV